MIASLTGTVLVARTDSVVIEVSGVGLQVLTTPSTVSALRVGSQASLATTLVVREDSLTLYGFSDAADRDAFQILQSVSGIGPRIAMAALATYGADELRDIVASEDEAALTKISGIGKKGAQRLILELAGKLGPAVGGSANRSRLAGNTSGLGGSWQSQVREALVGLGWTAREADDAVAAAQVEHGDKADVTVSEMLAQVLRGMSRR